MTNISKIRRFKDILLKTNESKPHPWERDPMPFKMRPYIKMYWITWAFVVMPMNILSWIIDEEPLSSVISNMALIILLLAITFMGLDILQWRRRSKWSDEQFKKEHEWFDQKIEKLNTMEYDSPERTKLLAEVTDRLNARRDTEL